MILDSVDWSAVRRQYDERMRAHRELLRLHKQKLIKEFADLALGISDPHGNYSAAEHGLGPKILGVNLDAAKRVFDLAENFIALTAARTVPALIRSAQLIYLQIGVGSEISCMVNPQTCWVCNVRTIWTHLVFSHGDDTSKADDQLKLYREADVTSEMAYKMWVQIHADLKKSLTRIAKLARERSKRAKITPGTVIYTWADATASHLYGTYRA